VTRVNREQATSGSAPFPVPGLAIAIVGHRPERITDASAVSARLADTLETIATALRKIGDDRPLPRLVSALAEGADRMGAHAALALGMPLDVVLPFRPCEYEQDFATQASLREFRALLNQAASVIALDGAEAARERAYDAVGMALLDNADLLVAVWDGGPGRGRGGTREVIAEAARRAMPVVVLSEDGRTAAIHSGGRNAGPMRLEDVPALDIADLPAIVAAIAGAPTKEHVARFRRLTTAPSTRLVHGAYPLLLKLAGVAPWRTRRAPHKVSPPNGLLDEAFRWWDATAIRAAQAFRSAVIVNFALAALAVVLAATSILCESW
jgi:hypothetical protein